MRKDVAAFARILSRSGLRVERGAHYKVFNNDGRLVTVLAMSPSDHRWRKNAIRDLRRAGIELGRRAA